jgi:formylglycine-generating enzyme required for sulfatase activity
MPLLPGEILNKRYRIISLLAEGAYGAVYRAWDLIDERETAIKEYLDATVEMQKRFREEARRLSRLKHEMLPEFLDHFALEESGQYLVTEFIPGIDLQGLLSQYGPLPSDLIVVWLQAVCKPLRYLHQQGFLHLNIKPANLRLTPRNELFLVDTGLPGLGLHASDHSYCSPEQEGQLETTAASDVYSLGATLYTLLTAKTPPDALRRESGLVDLLPAREVNPDVEPYLSIVATRAMSLRADARYESAAKFAEALQRPAGRPEPEILHPRRTAERQRLPSPRPPARNRRQMERRTIWALSVLLILIIITGLGFGLLNVDFSGGDPEESTATVESAVIAALTAIAPSSTPLPVPTALPTPTPEPFITESGARLLFMPAGVYRMGDNDAESDEQPAHLVRLDPFFIDETEVTNGQYALCVEDGACNPPFSSEATYHPGYYGDPAFDDYPVIFVNWFDADTFCGWRGGRLPTEAEWEMAAGFDPVQSIKLRYPWGDAFSGLRLNYCDAACPLEKRALSIDDGHRDTAPVGSYQQGRSPIGSYDMLGNVMEWIADWYHPRHYRSSTDINPLGPLEGEFKVLRGGSWLSAEDELSVTARGSFDPTVARANLGFRCAMNVP